jgi:hypothetical protein
VAPKGPETLGKTWIWEIHFQEDWIAYHEFHSRFGNPFPNGLFPWEFGWVFLQGKRIYLTGSPHLSRDHQILDGFQSAQSLEVPAIFTWLLQAGKVPETERVLEGGLWGESLTLPVFSAQYHCHDELAWISICPGGDLKKDLEIFFKKNGFKEESSRLEGIRHITGSFLGKPLNFAHFEQGWASIEGCHDAEWVRSRLHKQVEILPQGSAALFLKKNAISN